MNTIEDLTFGANKAHLAVENKDFEFLKTCDTQLFMAKDRDGETPLHYAAVNDDLEICKLLIERNPDIVNITDIENKTAYDWCLEYYNEHTSHTKIIKLLVAYVDVFVFD
jgi:ankyrin repeat protein